MTSNGNRKFFQLRSMTKNLDDTYRDDYELCKVVQSTRAPRNKEKMQQDEQLLRDWDTYKRHNLRIITHNALESPCFQVCLCDFLNGRRCSMEVWIRVAYDIFHDDGEGRNFRMRFWNTLRRKAFRLEQELRSLRWPEEWRCVEKDPCLNFEIIKLFEQYLPIRVYLAENINTLCNTNVDLRRMPFLIEDRNICIDHTHDTWLPKIQICGPIILEQLYNAESFYCQQTLKFILHLKDIMFPILDLFGLSRKKGKVLNLYGREHDFMLELLYSLKSVCGKPIRVTQGSLRIKKQYKTVASMKMNEDDCRIILTTFTQNDINEEVISDIMENLTVGYQAFGSAQQSQTEKRFRFVVILSENRLNFKSLKEGILYHKIPDTPILQIKRQFDYQFLVYYTNLLFNKAMTVQQNCSSRKPFYQLMICVWTYLFPTYFHDSEPQYSSPKIFEQVKALMEDVTIELDVTQSQNVHQLYEVEEINEVIFIEQRKKPKLY